MAKVVRLSSSTSLAKALSGGGEDFQVPNEWSKASYGSGWPVQPVSAPQDVKLPRTIDYPMAVNSTLTPRTGWGLMPFAALLEAYENVTEVRIPVNLIWRELTTFIPRLVDKDGGLIMDHPYQWICETPDGETPFSIWLTRFLKSAKVYDAPAVYMDKDAMGAVKGLHYIDGSTMFIIVDQFGNVPKPENIEDYIRREAGQEMAQKYFNAPVVAPDKTISNAITNLREFVDRYQTYQRSGRTAPSKIPAYAQVIKGTPFSWWSSDQVWYMPQSRRMNSPYGESFIEQAWSWIMILVNITAFELGHYKTGNMPEGFITLPSAQYSSPDKILIAELMYNQRMSSNPATERMRLRMFPDGTKYLPTKKPDFPKDLYKQGWANILHAIGIPPSEFGEIPGMGIGGKGFKEGTASDLDRNTLDPHRNFIKSMFNAALKASGVTDVTFDLAYPDNEINPDKKRARVYEGMAHGTLSLNDALGELSLTPVGDIKDPSNVANKHLIVAGSSVYVIEDLVVTGGVATPSFAPAIDPGYHLPKEYAQKPKSAEEIAGAGNVQHSPADIDTVKKLIKAAVETGQFNPQFMSIPGSSSRTFTKTTAKSSTVIAAVVSGELDKHCGVCPEDEDYFGSTITREANFTFPNTNHVNSMEIVAMQPEGLPAKAALWKPEGGENTSMQDMVGGPMYLREEAAYLLDRSLNLMLVPVSFVSDVDDEMGAAIYYTGYMGPPMNPEDYAPDWLEKAAVLDFVSTQMDRGYKHNYGTHPDDPTRMILYDNGMSFPEDLDCQVNSPFCDSMVNKPLSDSMMSALALCLKDSTAWHDIQSLVGLVAVTKAQTNIQTLLDDNCIPPYITDDPYRAAGDDSYFAAGN